MKYNDYNEGGNPIAGSGAIGNLTKYNEYNLDGNPTKYNDYNIDINPLKYNDYNEDGNPTQYNDNGAGGGIAIDSTTSPVTFTTPSTVASQVEYCNQNKEHTMCKFQVHIIEVNIVKTYSSISGSIFQLQIRINLQKAGCCRHKGHTRQTQ